MAEELVGCPDCQNGWAKTTCISCDGLGRITCSLCHGSGDRYDYLENRLPCRECKGAGGWQCDLCPGTGFIENKCSTCHGIGQLERSVAFGIVEQRQQAARKAEEARIVRQRQAEEEKRVKDAADKLAQEERDRIWKAGEPARREAQRIADEADAKRRRKEEKWQLIKAAGELWNIIGGCGRCGCIAIGAFFLFTFFINPHIRYSSRPTGATAQVSDPTDSAALSSSERELTQSDLTGKSKWQLDVMRNEPYARHGYKFGQGKANAPLYTYFSKFSWYSPNSGSISTVYARFNHLERHNVGLIQNYQKVYGMQ